ncbi:MAG TPA: hypothetical protein VLE19_12470 [Pyrinomonadaceae bacterium]|jgi:hypothetical protein|nr:hypothetical protein [Pyrinomonadaceae bacterium]
MFEDGDRDPTIDPPDNPTKTGTDTTDEEGAAPIDPPDNTGGGN